MTALELDPLFMKALKFLHSKAKDSGAQLKALLDDAIAQRKGLKSSAYSDVGKSSPSRSKSDDDLKQKEPEKRSSDKSGKDNMEPDIKKIKLDSKSRSKDERDLQEKEKDRLKREKETKEKEERDTQKLKDKMEKEKKEKELLINKTETVMVVSDEEEPASQMDAGDFALEMGIACVVCRQFDVSSGNQLVECQECHSLYHQECHKPPVTEEDVSDPRFVWYCFRCTRSLKKMVTQKSAKPKPPAPPVIAGKESSMMPSKSVKTETSSRSVIQAFRRIDPKSIVTTAESTGFTNTTSKPMVGLAGLAANLHKSKGESKSSSGSRKGESKGEGTKSSSKVEIKPSSSGNKSDSSSKSSNGGSKSDSSSKPNSFSKSEEKKPDSLKSVLKEDKEKIDSGYKSNSKTDDRKSGDIFSKLSSSLGKEEKKSDCISKSDKKLESGKSPSNFEGSKLDISSPNSSPPQFSASATLDSLSPSKVSSSTSNKQAVANLSLVTANKRIQMMKKKAQTKPGTEKKLHIK